MCLITAHITVQQTTTILVVDIDRRFPITLYKDIAFFSVYTLSMRVTHPSNSVEPSPLCHSPSTYGKLIGWKHQAPVNTHAVAGDRQDAAGVDLSTAVLRSHRRDVVVAILSYPDSPLHVSV